MEDQQLYDLSSELGGVVQTCKHLMALHAYRYHVFVNGSDRGFECTYARMTSRDFHDKENPRLVRDRLMALRKKIDRALEELPGEDEVFAAPGWLQELRLERQMRGET